MNDAGVNIFFINDSYEIQKLSRKLAQRLGIKRSSEIIGKTCFGQFFDRENPCDQCPVSRSISFQTVVAEDIPLSENDSATEVRRATATPVMDEYNEVKQLIVDCLGGLVTSFAVDETERLVRDNVAALPQMPVEESGHQKQHTIFAALFDNEFNIIVCNQWNSNPGFGSGENIVGRNLLTAAPFYSQAPVREKIESFLTQKSADQIIFHTKADIYSDQWLDHHLYRLAAQSGLDAFLLISGADHDGGFMNSQAIMADKISMLSRFASRISHDVKNPLALISTSVEFLKTDLANVNSLDGVHQVVDYFDQIQDQVTRVIGILDTVNALKVHSMDTISEADAAELLDRAVTITLLSKPFPQNDIKVKIADSLPAIHVAEINIERALSELFKSLLKKAGEDGFLEINLAYIDDDEEYFILKIHSNVRQSTVLDLDEMMHEFFSSGNRFNINNLGLAIAYATIINHTGEMQVLTLDTGELEVLIKLPRRPRT